jgi:cyanophycinase
MAASRRKQGKLLVIGGAEDLDPSDMLILPRLVELAGGKQARLMVCAVATAEPEKSLRDYRSVFEKIGIADYFGVSLRDRLEGEEPSAREMLEKATGFFMTGGDQLRITSILAGTSLAERLRQRFEEDGLLVAGTSAGAAAMSGTMITGGEGGTVRRSDVQLAPGLGFWRDTTVDTHFDRSGRVHRLMAVFGQNPEVLGVGIDEDTAVEVVPGKRFTVLGRRTTMVFDGRVTHSNTPDVDQDAPLALIGSTLHVLPAGYGFDLEAKRPILPGGELAPES